MSVFFLKNKLSVPKNSAFECVIPKMVRIADKIAADTEDLVLKRPCDNNLVMENPTEVSFRFGRDRSTYTLRPFSRHQLCHKMGMPSMYFEKLSRTQGLSQLACYNMNELFKAARSELLFRTVGDCLRGVLTPKYRSFDSNEILDVFTDCVGVGKELNPGNLAIRGYCTSLDVFHLRFTTVNPVKTANDKDIYMGLEITSSDVGKYSLSVRFFIYKQVCTNGMCLSIFDDDLFTQRHIGITKDGFRKGLRESVASFPILVARAAEMVNYANRIDLRNNPIFNPDNQLPESLKLRELFQKYLGVGQDSLAVITGIAQQNYDTTLWGLGNAITEWAQYHEFERRKELEVKAGTLMTDFSRFLVA